MFTIGLFLFLSVFFLIFLYRKRKSYYHYSPHCNYRYDMPITKRIPLQNNLMVLPDDIGENDTVFARIHVSCSIRGYFWHPFIRIKALGRPEYRQYVEYGSKGYRYVNLSHIVAGAKERTLHFAGRYLQLRNEDIEITVYRNPSLDNKKILIMAPHPDDAEIAAYGLYAAYAKKVFILTVSPGENGYFHYKELYKKEKRNEQHLKKGMLRTWNSITVPMIAGVPPENMLMMGYFNETLEEMYRHPEKEIPSKIFGTTDVTLFRRQNVNPLAARLQPGSNWEALVCNIRSIVQHVKPDIIISPHPHIDSHEDHQYTTIALMEALRDSDYDQGTLWFYTNHYNLTYYPLGRMGSIMPLPPRFVPDVYFDSICSYPLTEEEQRDKILAFDAMNDLRPNTDYRSWKRLLVRGFTSLRARCFSMEKDYFNMYVRSNELFYIVSTAQLKDDAIREKIMKGVTK